MLALVGEVSGRRRHCFKRLQVDRSGLDAF